MTVLPISNANLAVSIAPVEFEHQPEPLGLGVDRPRLSWVITTATQKWLQSAYELEVFDAAGQRVAGTGRVESDESVLVAWSFAPLRSRERLAVRVRVWGTDSTASDWSAPAWVEAGLLQPSDWTTQFISPDWDEDTSRANPAPLLRREFEVDAGVRQARLY